MPYPVAAARGHVFQQGAAAAPAADWWDVAGETAVAAYQPIGADDLADSYIDLSGNGNDAAPGVAPTWASGTGWTFNGSTQYLTTGVIPANDQTWTAIIRFSGWSSAAYKTIIGSYNTSGFRLVIQRRDTAFFRLFHGSNSVGAATRGAFVATGVYAIAGRQGYLDGSADGAAISVGTGGTAAALAIGTSNFDGSPSGHAVANVLAAAIYSTELDASQVSDLTDAINALTG